MAVEKTQASAPPFQPRLQPRPVAVRGFAAALDEHLASAAPPAPGGSGASLPGSLPGNLPGSAPTSCAPPASTASPPSFAAAPALPRRLPGSAPISCAPPASTASGASNVTTRLGAEVVRGVIDRGAAPRQSAETVSPGAVAASDPSQFSPADEAALSAWSAALKPKAAKAPPPPERPLRTGVKEPTLTDAPSQVAQAVSATPESLAGTATAQIGKRYATGGENPKQGFDCSGLTSYVYGKGGVELPRNSREQFRQGVPVKREELRKGDLVFFGKKGVHHVGIYLEDGKFIHSASSGKSVRISSLDEPVWQSQYAGARRVL